MDSFSTEQINKKTLCNSSTQLSPLTVEHLDIEILPLIYEIIRCAEKNPLDNVAKQRDSQDCSQKILELQRRFDSARYQIKQLPGIDYNKEEQLQKLNLLKSQLMLKQELIKKYRNKYLANNERVIQRLSESYVFRRAAQIIVLALHRSKALANEQNMKTFNPERMRSFLKSFQHNIKEEIESAKDKLKQGKM